jgi:hypothetical protein
MTTSAVNTVEYKVSKFDGRTLLIIMSVTRIEVSPMGNV